MPVEKKKCYSKTRLYMDTTVTIKIVTMKHEAEIKESMDTAFQVFHKVEETCSRFDPKSEVMQLLNHIGEPLQVSSILFETIRFACKVSEITAGLFDPTVGYRLETNGFNKHYLTRKYMHSNLTCTQRVSYQDIIIDSNNRTILLKKPIILDLGAVAKGFAIDLAAQILRQYEGFIVEAGGDLFAGGLNEKDEPWVIGIRHPIQTEDIIYSLKLSDMAVCTSGSYERVSPQDKMTHHLIQPQTGQSVTNSISSTVIAPFAMMADAFSTAAFVIGGEQGIDFLENNGIQGMVISPALKPLMTKGLEENVYASK